MRSTHQSRPPFALNQSICSAIRKIVASDRRVVGLVLGASSRSRSQVEDAGIQRPQALISSARAIAAGDMSANQSPPSEAKHFCGAK